MWGATGETVTTSLPVGKGVTDDESLHPASVFFLALLGFAMTLVPLVATIDSIVFEGQHLRAGVPIASLVLAVPPAIEFAFSGRDPYLVARFALAFVVCYFFVILGQAVVYVGLGIPEPIPVAELFVLFATYAVAYVLVYRGGWARMKRAVVA